MDPNAALARIREEVAALDMLSSATTPEGIEAAASHAFDLAEHVRALDGWLSRGGFPPEEWREGPDAPSDDPYCAEHGQRFDPNEGCAECVALALDGDNYTGPTFREMED